MRLLFYLRCDKLPIIYRHRFVSLIKEALKRSDKSYKEILYGDSDKTKIVKPFTFAVKLPSKRELKKELVSIDDGIEVEEDVFYFKGGGFVRFIVSSYDYNFLINLYNGMVNLKEFPLFDGISATLFKSHLLKEEKIEKDEVCLKTLSPILIEDKEGKPIIPSQDNLEKFNNELNQIEDRIKKDLLKEKLKKELQLIPLKIKKEKVKLSIRNHRKENPILSFTPFSGVFKLNGNSEDLNFLYQKGIGLRTSQGFGMVEVV